MTTGSMTPPTPQDDELDTLLATAAGTPADDPRVQEALRDIVDRRPPMRRGPIVAIAAVGAVALALSGSAVAATVFGPWNSVPDPEFVVERVWTDASGLEEGTCRSHWRFDAIDEPSRGAILDILHSIAVDALEPDPATLDTLRDRIASGELDSWQWTDVHIRQRALEFSIWERATDEIEQRGLDPELLIVLNVETQCSVVGSAG